MKNFKDRLLTEKMMIGMVHLKSLPGSYGHKLSMDEIFEQAYQDLKALQEGGIDAAIIENYFDSPYQDNLSTITLISYVSIFSRLKEKATIPLGVNIQYTNGVEEMETAYLCGADFIRSETFMETRYAGFGVMQPQAAKLHNSRKSLRADVCILADIHVKYTFPIVQQSLEYTIQESIASGADAIILTSIKSGESPSLEDLSLYRKLAGNFPIVLGSGIRPDNVKKFMREGNAAIVGTAVKQNGDICKPVMKNQVKTLIAARNYIYHR